MYQKDQAAFNSRSITYLSFLLIMFHRPICAPDTGIRTGQQPRAKLET